MYSFKMVTDNAHRDRDLYIVNYRYESRYNYNCACKLQSHAF